MPKTLLVYANPYTHVSADGEPMGALPWDPKKDNPDRGWVGARVCSEIIERFDASKGDYRLPRQRTWFEFDHDPVRIPDTVYYRHAIRLGDLVIADAATAKALGVEFVDPQIVLAKAKSAAIADWKAHHGEVPASLTGHEFGTKSASDKAKKIAADKLARAELLSKETPEEEQKRLVAEAQPKPVTPANTRTMTSAPPAARGGE